MMERFDELSRKQSQILFLLCKGLRNSEVARNVGLAERTVKGYVSQLLLIFDVTNRTELVGRFALESAAIGSIGGIGHTRCTT